MPAELSADGTLPATSGQAWVLSGSDRSLADLDSLPDGFAAGDFLVGAANCGAGADLRIVRELRGAGVSAVIARSFSSDFFAHALSAGLPAMAVEEAAAIRPGDRLRVDVETYRIANLSSGDRYVIRNLSDEAIAALRAARGS